MNSEWKRTKELIPDGVQALSKMPSKYVEGVYPYYIDYGDGCCIYDCDGKEYIDYPLGLGAILLGHNMEDINRAVTDRMRKGLLFPVPHKLETELAEAITNFIPSMEMMRFVKTGSESVTAALRIARAYTEKKTVLFSGFHGWHDQYNATTPKHDGVPDTLGAYMRKFKHGDLVELEEKMTGKPIAAVLMEPYMYDEVGKEYLHNVRKLCDKHKCLLIFDEVVTGFRTKKYSAQEYFGVKADITCIGKALGNGLPIGAVGGSRDIMKVLEKDCFVSSTFGGELVSITAALAVLKYCEERGVQNQIWQMGQLLKDGFNNAVHEVALEGVECQGYPCRTYFKFPNEVLKSLFWQYCVKRGIFFGHAQFISYCHGYKEIRDTVEVCGQALQFVKQHWEEPQKALEGKPATEVFRMVATA